jgi:transcriptional regulator with XRE-family HTH domain
MTQARAARLIGETRNDISRLENGQSADAADVLNILEALGIDGDRWTALATVTSDVILTDDAQVAPTSACTSGSTRRPHSRGVRQAPHRNRRRPPG